MANAYRNADLSSTIFWPLQTGRRFTAKISNLFLVPNKCNIWIYFLLLLTQVDFFGTTFYFLESRKFSHYFYFLKSRIFGIYFYFLETSKVIYFWQHCSAENARFKCADSAHLHSAESVREGGRERRVVNNSIWSDIYSLTGNLRPTWLRCAQQSVYLATEVIFLQYMSDWLSKA